MRKSGETQKAVYNYIKEFIAINSYPPTVREIGAALGLRSTSTVHMHIFMLRVQGQSMIEAGINDGDIIIIHRGMSVESGEIGVVRVSGESATLKRVFYENGSKIRLQPENSSMQPIIVDINDVEIVGKLIGLYREY